MSGIRELHLTRRELMITAAGCASLLLSPLGLPAIETPADAKWGRGQLFDSDWRFHRGALVGGEAPGYEHSDWRTVDLPHDWSIEDLPRNTGPAGAVIEGPFDSKAEGGTATGFTVGGEGWYRKRFRLRLPAGARVEMLFDGIYMDSDIWLNGHHLGTHPYGYTPFAYNLTPYLAHNGENVIAVRVRNLGQNSRWYAGSGIYRHVWLDVLPEKARLERWGTRVFTCRIAGDRADIEIDTRLEDPGAGLALLSRVRDDFGRIVWEETVAAQSEVRQSLSIASPRLWSPDSPALYRLEIELRRGPVVIDRHAAPFGVRIVTFDTVDGTRINGKTIKLRGGCIHASNGILGAASFDAAEDRKVRLLKARGFNAVRPAHNPYSPAFLDACDRHGLLVLGETFDTWFAPKLPQDYHLYFRDWWRSDLATIVRSERNHPSIIMWSIGNEIPERNSPAGIEAQWRLGNLVHELDPTRPVTAALNDFLGRPVIPGPRTARPGRADIPDQASTVFLDIAGYNYRLDEYVHDHEAYPARIIVGTESFPKDVFATWSRIDKLPYVLGDFVWTAMDYLGEAGVGGSVNARAGTPPMLALIASWPWVISDCGDLDLLGYQKAASYARDVVWGLSPLEVVVQGPLPEGEVELVRPWGWPDARRSWTWPGAEGKQVSVRVYTTGDHVEFRLNGRTIASKRLTDGDLKHTELSMAYQPGVLEAVTFRDGEEIARQTLETAGPPAALRITPENPTAGAGREDICHFGIEVLDAQGRRVPGAAQDVTLRISGPAELAGFGSANPRANPGFQSTSAKTWDGRALAILRGTGRTGVVKVAAHGAGLKEAVATVPFRTLIGLS